MSGWLQLHAIAQVRGDGLHPRLRDLLEFRALALENVPSLVVLDAVRADGLARSGPRPAGTAPTFLHGNLLPFDAPPRRAATAVRRTARP